MGSGISVIEDFRCLFLNFILLEKRENMYKYFILILLVLFCSCSVKPVRWVTNGTTLQAKKYRLEISDSSKILIENDKAFSLLLPHDSLFTNKFTISYSAVDTKTNKYFKTKAHQQVKNTLNPKVTEYYRFDNGNVLLLGYATSDRLKPYTIFEPALIISPASINEETKSSGVMKTFITENNSFDEGFNTNFKIKELKQIKLKVISKRLKICNLQELILTRDATVSYGENNLIMPEAIMFKNKLLIDTNGLPIAEWSVKVEKINNNNNEPEELGIENQKTKTNKLYIEFTKYEIH